MLQCRKDVAGIIELTLSHIGLFLASAVLLTIVFLFVFSNDWHRTAELQSIASDFSNLLQDLDNLFYESEYYFQFPKKNYQYRVFLSTEYIALSAQGSWGSNLFVTQRFFTTPWPRLPTQNWTTGTELRSYLKKTYGHQGIQQDPISTENFTRFLNEQHSTVAYFALQPFEIQPEKPVVLEKVRLFYELEMEHDVLIIYQWI